MRYLIVLFSATLSVCSREPLPTDDNGTASADVAQVDMMSMPDMTNPDMLPEPKGDGCVNPQPCGDLSQECCCANQPNHFGGGQCIPAYACGQDNKCWPEPKIDMTPMPDMLPEPKGDGCVNPQPCGHLTQECCCANQPNNFGGGQCILAYACGQDNKCWPER